MTYFGAFLDRRGYESVTRTIRTAIAYPASIEKEQRFPDIVLVDGTYGTN